MTHTARMLRFLRNAAFLALLLVGAAPHARAEDDPAVAFFDARVAAMSKTCIDKLWDAASGAKSQNFFQYANETAELILLDWDPDHAGARGMLGYVRTAKDKDWFIDPKANVSKQNTKNTKEAQASYDAREKKWKELRAKVDVFIASKYAGVGTECAAKGFAEQAQKAAERALALDPQCAEARKLLGYEKLGTAWVTKEKAEAVKRAAEGKPVEGASDLDTLLGVTLSKIATPHFRVEDDGPKDALPAAAKALETMYAYFLADAGRDPAEDVFGGKVVEMCVVSKKDLWDKWVDARSGEKKNQQWLKESNTYRNLAELRTGTLRVETAESVDTRDPLLHHAAHILGYTVWRSTRHAWLDEGLAYYYTVKVQETTRTHCVAKDEGGYAKGPPIGGEKNWTVSERWKPFLKDLVVKKGDAELRKLLNTKLEVLDLPSSVKAWGVVGWLMDKQHDKFLEFLKALRARANPDKEPQEAILEKVFGTSIEAMDAEWRAYAARAY